MTERKLSDAEALDKIMERYKLFGQEGIFEDSTIEFIGDVIEFIAHAREDIPWLVREVVRLRGLVPGDTTQRIRDAHELMDNAIVRGGYRPGEAERVDELLAPWLAPAAEDGTA